MLKETPVPFSRVQAVDGPRMRLSQIANGMVRRRNACSGLTTGKQVVSYPAAPPIAKQGERRAAPPGTRLSEGFCLFGEAKKRGDKI